MAKEKQDVRKPEKAFTVEEFKQLSSKAASLRKEQDADRISVEKLTTEIKSKTTTGLVVDPSNKDAKIQRSTPLRPAEIATRRAQRSQLLLKIADTTAVLKTLEKDLRIAAKQISQDSNQGAAVARAKFSASKNPDRFFTKLIDKMSKSDGKMGRVIRQFRKEWAEDPTAIRAEVLDSIRENFPTMHRLIVENPKLEQAMFELLLDDTEKKK